MKISITNLAVVTLYFGLLSSPVIGKYLKSFKSSKSKSSKSTKSRKTRRPSKNRGCDPDTVLGRWWYLAGCQGGVVMEADVSCGDDGGDPGACSYKERRVAVLVENEEGEVQVEELDNLQDSCTYEGSFRLSDFDESSCELGHVPLDESTCENNGLSVQLEIEREEGEDGSAEDVLVLRFSNDGGASFYNENDPRKAYTDVIGRRENAPRSLSCDNVPPHVQNILENGNVPACLEKDNEISFGTWPYYNPTVKLLPYKKDLSDPEESVGWTDRTLFHTKRNANEVEVEVNSTHYSAMNYTGNTMLGVSPNSLMAGADHEPVASVFEFIGGNGKVETIVQVSWNLGGEGEKIFKNNAEKFASAMKEVFKGYSMNRGGDSPAAFVFGFEETWAPVKFDPFCPMWSYSENQTKEEEYLEDAARATVERVCTCADTTYTPLPIRAGVGNTLSGILLYDEKKVKIPEKSKIVNIYRADGYTGTPSSDPGGGWGCNSECREIGPCIFDSCTKGAITFHFQLQNLGDHDVYATTLHLPANYHTTNMIKRFDTLGHIKSQVENLDEDGDFTHIMGGDFNFRLIKLDNDKKHQYAPMVMEAIMKSCFEAYPELPNQSESAKAKLCAKNVNENINRMGFTVAVEDKLFRKVMYPRDEWSFFKWQRTPTTDTDIDVARHKYQTTMIKKSVLDYLQSVPEELYELMEPFSDKKNPPLYLPYPSYKMKGSQ